MKQLITTTLTKYLTNKIKLTTHAYIERRDIFKHMHNKIRSAKKQTCQNPAGNNELDWN